MPTSRRRSRVYEGTYTNPSGGPVPSRVFEFSKQGALLRSWTVAGQIARRGARRPGGDQRLARPPRPARQGARPRPAARTPAPGASATYATFPAAATPNYAAWGKGGALYVSDYLHPIALAGPARRRRRRAVARGPALDGAEFGSTGLELTADRRHLLLATQSSAGGGDGNPATGKLYEIAIGADGAPGEITTVWESRLLDAPDGFALAAAAASTSASCSRTRSPCSSPDGASSSGSPATRCSATNGTSVPFDNPSSVAFLGRRIVVANQSFLQRRPRPPGDPRRLVGEPGPPEFIPRRAGRRRH